MALPFSHQVFGTLGELASIPKNLSCGEILCLHACSVHWEGTLLSQLLFSFLNSSFQICLERQTIFKFFCPPFSESKSGPLYCPPEYAVTLSPVLSKRSPGPVLIQEVLVRLCASFSPAESISLQFSFLLRLPHPPEPVSEASVCKRA